MAPPVTADAPNVTTARRRLHNFEPQAVLPIGAATNSLKSLYNTPLHARGLTDCVCDCEGEANHVLASGGRSRPRGDQAHIVCCEHQLMLF